MGALLRLMPLMARSAKTTDVHKKELIEDFKQNRASDSVLACVEYLDYIAEDRDFAAELAASGNPVWVVHAEKGDGGLTDAERATLRRGSQRDPGDDSRLGVPPPGRGPAGDRRSDRKRSVAGVLTGDTLSSSVVDMAGAPLSDEVSIRAMSRRAGELAKEQGCGLVVGFSHGATVVLDMVLSGHFQGPVVLLGISSTTADEAAFFRGVVRASQKVGSWPNGARCSGWLMPLMARSAKTTDVHKRELIEDFKQNRASDSVVVCGEDPRLHRRRPGLRRRAGRVGHACVGGARREGGRRPHRRRARHPRCGSQRESRRRIAGLGVPTPGPGPTGDRRSDR